MPNWCYNRVTAYGDEDKLKEIEKIFESKTPFNDIFPMPDFKTIPNENGELPKLEQMKNPDGSILWETYNWPDGTNDDRWYSWNVANWGCKWDIDSQHVEDEDGWFQLEFSTPWGPPNEIYDRLVELFPDVGISWFYDEPGMGFAGYLPD